MDHINDPQGSLTETPAQRGPLTGVTVVDFTQAAAGPFCTQQLADLGAEVIKIEPPSGDMIRGWDEESWDGLGTYFMGLNRNKRSVVIDLHHNEGRRIAEQLVSRADILVENYRPGTMGRLGLAYDKVIAINPDIIYVSITAFGEDGPLAQRPGMDIILQAFAGIMGITGEAGRAPVKVGAPVADLVTGYAATVAALAAYATRENGGSGQRVHISMLKAVTSLISNHATGHLLRGNKVERLGSSHPQLVPYQAFETLGGHYLVVGILNERFWSKFCVAIDRPDLEDDARFKENSDRVANRDVLIRELSGVLRAKSSEEWHAIFLEHDVPHTPVNMLEDLFAHEQSVSQGLVVWVDHPKVGRLPLLANPADFEKTPVSYRSAPPFQGENTAEVLSELGIDADELARLVGQGVVG